MLPLDDTHLAAALDQVAATSPTEDHADVIAVWKTHSMAPVRKKAQEIAKAVCPAAFAIVDPILKRLPKADPKLTKKLEELEAAGLAFTTELAFAISRRHSESLGLSYLCAVGGKLAAEALQIEVDKMNGRLDLGRLRAIPNEIAGLRGVNEVSLYGMGLASIDDIFQLPDVERAYLQRNKLKSVPSKLRQWKKIDMLYLGDNPLTTADDVCALTTLRGLELATQKMKSLPAEIGNLTQLRFLDLGAAAVPWAELPDSFFSLKKLEKLRLPWDLAPALAPRVKEALPDVEIVKGGAVLPYKAVD